MQENREVNEILKKTSDLHQIKNFIDKCNQEMKQIDHIIENKVTDALSNGSGPGLIGRGEGRDREDFHVH